MSAIEIYERFAGHESTVAAVAEYMARHRLAPMAVAAAYDDWLDGLPRGAPPRPPAPRGASAAPGRRGRHKAGDQAQWARACPKCGGTLEILQLCPISSPHWRSQLACMVDGCDWHGLSTLSIDALLAAGPAAFNINVREA